MSNTIVSFRDYMSDSKKILKMLFGKDIYKQMESTPLKSISWKGIDVNSCQITATFPNVKDRFNKEWIKYFSERNVTLLDLYLQVIFHFGYQQCYDCDKPQRDMVDKILKSFFERESKL